MLEEQAKAISDKVFGPDKNVKLSFPRVANIILGTPIEGIDEQQRFAVVGKVARMVLQELIVDKPLIRRLYGKNVEKAARPLLEQFSEGKFPDQLVTREELIAITMDVGKITNQHQLDEAGKPAYLFRDLLKKNGKLSPFQK